MNSQHINLIEVGPRDGFQLEKKIIPTDMKIRFIEDLVSAGLKEIQVTSFVNPRRVPQMADAEEVVKRLPQRDGVIFTGLALNTQGVERAFRAGLKSVEVSISASDAHSRRNAGMSLEQGLEQAREMVRLARGYQMRTIASIQCAFGCMYQGEVSIAQVLSVARSFAEQVVDRISVADTTGMGTPFAIRRMVKYLLPEIGRIPIGLHLHDTRGMGLVNLMAGLESGIVHFDTAFGGMGGCPFVQGAAGNIATEDTAYLLASMDMETGVDISGVGKCSVRMSEFLGRDLSGKVYRLIADNNFSMTSCSLS